MFQKMAQKYIVHKTKLTDLISIVTYISVVKADALDKIVIIVRFGLKVYLLAVDV